MPRPTGLQKVVAEHPFTGKLDQKDADELMPPLEMAVLSNVDLSEPGKIKRRNGHEDMSIAMYDGQSFGLVEKLAARGGELVCLQNQQISLGSGAGVGNAGDSIVSYSPAHEAWKNHGKVPRPTLRKVLTNREGQANTTSVAVTADGKYMILAWVAKGYKFSGGNNGQAVLAQVYDVSVEPPVLVEDTHVLDETAATSAEICVKCVALTNGELVVVWNYNGAGSQFAIMVGGYNVTSATWKTNFNSQPGAGNSSFDVCAYTSSSIVTITRWDLGARTIFREVASSGATFATNATAVSGTVSSGIAYAVDVIAGTIHGHQTDGTVGHYYRLTSMAGFASDHVATMTTAANRQVRVGVVGTSSTLAWVFSWDCGVSGTSPIPMVLHWRRVLSGVVSGGDHFLSGVVLTHNPFSISGRVYMPLAGCDVGLDGVTLNQGYYSRFGYALFEIDTANPSNTYATGIPAAAWATDVGNHKAFNAASGTDTNMLRGCVSGSKFYLSDLVVGEYVRGRRFEPGTDFQFGLDALDVVSFEFADPKRWDHREHGGQTIFGGGLLWTYDGMTGFECGWLWRPRVLSVTKAAGGSLAASSTYNIRLVYEFLDSDQKYWYSMPNYAVEFGGASATVDTDGVNKTINITFRPPSFTAMDKAYRNQTIRPRILVFMTNPPNFGAEEYFLVATQDFDPRWQTYSTITISTVAGLENSDRPYTFGGELENYTPPPATAIESHRDRMFAFSTYDFRLWYSKPLAYARGVEWVQEQTIPCPQEVVGMASLESALACFTKEQIYVLEGYGPSSTGVPPDAFARLVLLSAEVGLAEPQAFARTPVGVIFRSNQGWWLLDRTLSLKYLGAPAERTMKELDAYVTRSVDVDLKRGVVRFLMSNASEDMRLCYWYDTDRWSTDTLPSGRTFRDAQVIGDNYYIADTDVCMKLSTSSYEDGQHGLNRVYQMQVVSGWIRFDNLAQVKRVWRILVSLYKVAASGISMLTYRDFDTTTPTGVSAWADADLLTGSHILRVHQIYQKVRAVKISVQDLQNTNPPGPFSGTTAGFELLGFGFELGLKRGAAKAPATETK